MLYLSPVAAMLGGQPVRGHPGAPTRAGDGGGVGQVCMYCSRFCRSCPQVALAGPSAGIRVRASH